MFNFGKNPESSSKQEEDKEAVFGRAFSLLKEATDLFEKKEDLIDQLRQLQKKIADMKCINDDYLYLKSQIYIYAYQVIHHEPLSNKWRSRNTNLLQSKVTTEVVGQCAVFKKRPPGSSRFNESICN
ncbi:uncharacterized protein LOC122833668 isoform X3 [Gambusia affinis]|uniref:uncharacterized protein LOC122833668 isoform X3 n=1 Tax=Gambusia affinis TaxID=33528 RepID=UPI001CDCAAB5|nr:uncharacterized protein LOC122833668 isoform X3 [Gambusia affinis]